MSMGHGYHPVSQKRLDRCTVENGNPAPVVTSAGALVEGLGALEAQKVAIVAPYMKPLTQMVAEYIEHGGVAVQDWLALEIPDNLEMVAHDPANLLEHYRRLDLTGINALVLSEHVQMPSLSAIQKVEGQIGLPVVSAADCTIYWMLKELGIEAKIPGCGPPLSDKY